LSWCVSETIQEAWLISEHYSILQIFFSLT